MGGCTHEILTPAEYAGATTKGNCADAFDFVAARPGWIESFWLRQIHSLLDFLTALRRILGLRNGDFQDQWLTFWH